MLKAKKSLGQNFLSNPRILDKIVSAAEVSKEDTVLEVGPGTGSLTIRLAEKSKRVIAIEKDHRLIEQLQDKFKNFPNVEVVEGDIMESDIAEYSLKDGNYKIVANIPYYITSSLIRLALEKWPQPQLIVLMVQKEVAQRIMAMPAQAGKKPNMNLLALSVQYYAEPKIIGYISRGSFNPRPKVDSAIIRLKPLGRRATAEETEKIFILIRAGFSEKRKQLAGNLTKKLKIPKEQILDAFKKLGISSIIRAENLSLEQWITLRNYLNI